MGQDVPLRKVPFRVHPPHQGVEVRDLLLRDRPLLGAGASAHFLRLLIGLEPLVDLVGERAVGCNGMQPVVDVDVTFKGPGSLRVGDEHRGLPVVVLVRRVPDHMVGKPALEEIDLVQLQFVVLRGIQRYAVVDRQGDVPVLEENHEVVEVLQRKTACGDDDRFSRPGDLFDQGPVVQVGACDLDDLDPELDAKIDGFFIERRGHCDATALSYGRHKRNEMLGGHVRIDGLLDIADVRAIPVVLMDELLHVAELKLYGGLDVVESDDLGVLTDNLQPPIDLPPVVVGHFQHKKIFENISHHLGLLPLCQE